MRAVVRIFVSFCSLLLAVAVFSAWLGSMGSWLFIYKLTMFFALPVWFINLPLLFLLSRARRLEVWIVPALGAFIGPVCLILWCCIVVLRGNDWLNLWKGDPEAFGLGPMLIVASLIGLITNSLYTVALQILRRRMDGTAPGAPHKDESNADPQTR